MRKTMRQLGPKRHPGPRRFTPRAALRTTKSYSLDPDILDFIGRTQGELSASERVNQLLRQAIVADEYRALEREAAEFFSHISAEERREAAAYEAATIRALARD